MRAHRVCPGPEGRALAIARAPLVVPGVARSSGAPGGLLRSHGVRQVPEPCADRPRVLVTVWPAPWQPASSNMRLLHRETRMHVRSYYMSCLVSRCRDQICSL